MAIPSSILGPVVGAFISGLIGVITVEYRNHRDEVAEIEGWYDQSIRLAEQVERETPDSYLEAFHNDREATLKDATGERRNDMAAAYGRIGERLRDHVNRAPPQVEEEVMGYASEAARHCQILDREPLGPTGFLQEVEDAVESAKNLQESAVEAKQEVGLFR